MIIHKHDILNCEEQIYWICKILIRCIKYWFELSSLLYTFIILARHLKCRNVFPDGIPIMDNRAKGEEANNALEVARNEFRENAKKINLVLDTVDPTGNNTT